MRRSHFNKAQTLHRHRPEVNLLANFYEFANVHSPRENKYLAETVAEYPKAVGYREELVPLLGKSVTISTDNIEVFNGEYFRSKKCTHVLMHKPVVIGRKGNIITIDHLWVLLDNGWISRNGWRSNVNGIEVKGLIYEYAKREKLKDGIKVRNIGLWTETAKLTWK